MTVAQQRALVATSTDGSVMARYQAVGLSRSSYYRPRGESALNLQLMGLLDEEYTRHSFKGVLNMRDHLRLQGYAVNGKRVRRLLRRMGLQAVYSKPRLSVPGEGITRYPYLLREQAVTAPNEVWNTDITYVPMPGASSTWWLCWTGTALRAQVGTVQHARCGLLPDRPGPGVAPVTGPYIFNSDQGSQFTSTAFEQALLAAGCQIRRDGRGRATDNALVERLWRSVKWECVYLNPS